MPLPRIPAASPSRNVDARVNAPTFARMQHHIPERRKGINVNPWPMALRRILMGIALLLLIAFCRSLSEWAFDHFAGEKRLSFNLPSLAYLVISIAIAAGLLFTKVERGSYDSGMRVIKLFLTGLFLSILLVFFVIWPQQQFGDMFKPGLPESYVYPYHGVTLLLSTWLSIAITFMMLGVVFLAFKDARSNVYQDDDVPL